MKKRVQIALFFFAVLAASLVWWQGQSDSKSPEVLVAQAEDPPSKPELQQAAKSSPVTAPIQAEGSQIPLMSVSSLDKILLPTTLAGKLDPQAIEDFTKKNAIPLKRETLGHPKTGQRLELTWGSDPVTTAVFDIMDQQKFQLSAVRSIFPASFSLVDLKEQLKATVGRQIDREDENMLVFAADEHGLVVWLAKNEDGSFKLASEFVSPGHESSEH